MQWYSGKPCKLMNEWKFKDSPLWADYQVLGPNFGAVSVLLSVTDVLPIIIGSRGCATHLRFTKLAWGIDYDMRTRPLPFIELSKSDVVNGTYKINEFQLLGFEKLINRLKPNLIVLMANDASILSCIDLSGLKAQIEEIFHVRTSILEVSAISSSNQWVGYDKGLGILFDLYINNEEVQKKEGVNLVGWKWPSRERNHDIGACIDLLDKLNIPVNYVIPGGSCLNDIRESLGSQANVLWCPSYIGDTLERIERERNIPIAGFTPPYGFDGTMDWITEIANVLEKPSIIEDAKLILLDYQEQVVCIQNELRGKRAFVSGGPGRLPGLLSIMADLKVNVVNAALYWPHHSSRKTLDKVIRRLPSGPKNIIVGPSLYEIEDIASSKQVDFWMGGFQEQHSCKRYEIPFIPTTVHLASHQCFEGVINVGQKIKKALEGYDFVASSFRSTEKL